MELKFLFVRWIIFKINFEKKKEKEENLIRRTILKPYMEA
jgi:hypothetical protein